jgi:hypothetical protein
LIGQSSGRQAVSFAAAQPIDAVRLAQVHGVEDLTCDGLRARFRTADVTATVSSLMAFVRSSGLELTELHVQKATLEEVFIELTRPS